MANELAITSEYNLGLYDSDTGESLKTQKAVDISDECPEASPQERVVLLFTEAKRGRIVQIGRPYPHEVYMGAHIHFFVDELASLDDSLAHQAKMLGLSKSALTKIIIENAPAPTQR